MKCSLENPMIQNDILGDTRTGLWCIELDEGVPGRLLADATCREMMGMGDYLTPEDAYLYWNERICESDRVRVMVLADEMAAGRHCEAEYAWRHPELGVITVRCGGRRDPSYTAGVRLRGSHQNVTDIVRVRRSIEGRLGTDLVEGSAPSDIGARREAMMRVLCEDYVSIYYYDLGRRAFTPYLLDDWARGTWQVVEGEWYPYRVMRLYVENFVDDRFKEELRAFADPDQVVEMLKASATHTVITRYKCIYGGEAHYFYLKVCAVYERGEMAGFACAFCLNDEEVGREVRQRQILGDALERAERANRAKTEFLGNMSHDVRTPLNAVRGFASLAERRIDDRDALRDCLAKIKSSSDLLLKIVDDVFELARLDSGALSLKTEPHDVDSALRAACAMVAEDARRAGLDLLGEVDVADRSARFDGARLDQILVNLLDNAIKFTPAGGSVAARATQIQGGPYVFEVSDTGIGMNPDFAACAFGAFERERSSTESGIEGTGLGLSIVSRLAALMGGTVSVESAPGAGSRFRVELPLEPVACDGDGSRAGCPADAAGASDAEAERQAWLTGRRVLLVEDNELSREIVRDLLERWGVEVDEAYNGALAVERVRFSNAGYYDAIIMDIQMPVMGGIEATRAIRSRPGHDAESLPIVAMTANEIETSRDDALACGMNDLITKPIDAGALFEALRRPVLPTGGTHRP